VHTLLSERRCRRTVLLRLSLRRRQPAGVPSAARRQQTPEGRHALSDQKRTGCSAALSRATRRRGRPPRRADLSPRLLRDDGERLPTWSAGKLRFAMDMHCPAARGGSHETVYFVGGPNEQVWNEVGKFCQTLEQIQTGPIVYRSRNNMPFGKEWNTAGNIKLGK